MHYNTPEQIQEEGLKPEETQRFVKVSFRDSTLKTIGIDIDRFFSRFPASPLQKSGQRRSKGAS